MEVKLVLLTNRGYKKIRPKVNWRLDLTILEVFTKLGDSTILWIPREQAAVHDVGFQNQEK